MDALSLLAMVAAATNGADRAPDPIARWQPIIAEASARFGVPTSWIERVMAAESGGRTLLAGSPIRSRVGAIGLMQVMPATWADMRSAYSLGTNADDPRDNILAGTAYLRLMYDRFGYPGLFAAYNAGPRRYADALATGRLLPDETLAYLATITRQPATMPTVRRSAVMQDLFVIRRGGGEQQFRPPGVPAAPSLFAVRSVTP